jgi:hypothetical protein
VLNLERILCRNEKLRRIFGPSLRNVESFLTAARSFRQITR